VYRLTCEVVLPIDEYLGYTRCFKPRSRKIIPDRMLESEHDSCNNILKIFVASHPTSFDFLELPELGDTDHVKPPKKGEEVDGVTEDWMTEEFLIRVVR
jgi:hypothetical protein